MASSCPLLNSTVSNRGAFSLLSAGASKAAPAAAEALLVSVTAEADGMMAAVAGVPPTRLNTAEAEGCMAPPAAAAARRWALDLEGRWSERGLLGIVFTGVARMGGGK